MKEQVDVPGTGLRFLVMLTLLGLSVCRLLVRNDYGFINPEVLVLLALIAAACGVLAVLTSRPLVFGVVASALIMALSVDTVQYDLLPTVRYRWLLLGMALALGLAIYFMRRRFYEIVLVFIVCSFGVDVGLAALNQPPHSRPAGTARNPNAEHVLYLILDEQIGLRGFPENTTATKAAKTALRDVFINNRFTLFPNVFSNYSRTFDSVPSIVNGRLLDHAGEYFGEERPTTLYRNRVFERYVAEGYDIRVYQSDHIDYRSPDYPTVVAKEYQATRLAAIEGIDLDWTERLGQILIIYSQSNKFLWELYGAHAPAEYRPRSLPVGPLALAKLWPNELLTDIYDAERKTLFFAHLLIPHAPYTFGPDGEVTASDRWPGQATYRYYDQESYADAYQRYAGQVLFMTRQLESMIQTLKEYGVFESMTIIVHGDHGSRIRSLGPQERAARDLLDSSIVAEVARYDYVSEPRLQDLFDRFSTLLALKPPGATAARVVEERSSVASVLWSSGLFPGEAMPMDKEADYVYLFDEDGRPQQIDLLSIWKDEETER